MKKVANQHMLDAAATEQVKWYANQFGRDPQHVVSGIVTGAIKRLREGYDEIARECDDATAGTIEADVIAAMQRRAN